MKRYLYSIWLGAVCGAAGVSLPLYLLIFVPTVVLVEWGQKK